jgi:hypothetical protein
LIETLTLTWLFAIPRVVSFVATWSGSYCHLFKSFFVVSMASKPWDHFKLLKGGILHLTHTHLTIKQKTIKQNKTNTHTHKTLKQKKGLKKRAYLIASSCLYCVCYCFFIALAYTPSPPKHTHTFIFSLKID